MYKFEIFIVYQYEATPFYLVVFSARHYARAFGVSIGNPTSTLNSSFLYMEGK